jgi:hypothetical protein
MVISRISPQSRIYILEVLVALKGHVATCVALTHPVTSIEETENLAAKIDTSCDRLQINQEIRSRRSNLADLLQAYGVLGNVPPPSDPDVDIEWFNRDSVNFQRIRAAGMGKAIRRAFCEYANVNSFTSALLQLFRGPR